MKEQTAEARLERGDDLMPIVHGVRAMAAIGIPERLFDKDPAYETKQVGEKKKETVAINLTRKQAIYFLFKFVDDFNKKLKGVKKAKWGLSLGLKVWGAYSGHQETLMSSFETITTWANEGFIPQSEEEAALLPMLEEALKALAAHNPCSTSQLFSLEALGFIGTLIPKFFGDGVDKEELVDGVNELFETGDAYIKNFIGYIDSLKTVSKLYEENPEAVKAAAELKGAVASIRDRIEAASQKNLQRILKNINKQRSTKGKEPIRMEQLVYDRLYRLNNEALSDLKAKIEAFKAKIDSQQPLYAWADFDAIESKAQALTVIIESLNKAILELHGEDYPPIVASKTLRARLAVLKKPSTLEIEAAVLTDIKTDVLEELKAAVVRMVADKVEQLEKQMADQLAFEAVATDEHPRIERELNGFSPIEEGDEEVETLLAQVQARIEALEAVAIPENTDQARINALYAELRDLKAAKLAELNEQRASLEARNIGSVERDVEAKTQRLAELTTQLQGDAPEFDLASTKTALIEESAALAQQAQATVAELAAQAEAASASSSVDSMSTDSKDEADDDRSLQMVDFEGEEDAPVPQTAAAKPDTLLKALAAVNVAKAALAESKSGYKSMDAIETDLAHLAAFEKAYKEGQTVHRMRHYPKDTERAAEQASVLATLELVLADDPNLKKLIKETITCEVRRPLPSKWKLTLDTTLRSWTQTILDAIPGVSAELEAAKDAHTKLNGACEMLKGIEAKLETAIELEQTQAQLQEAQARLAKLHEAKDLPQVHAANLQLLEEVEAESLLLKQRYSLIVNLQDEKAVDLAVDPEETLPHPQAPKPNNKPKLSTGQILFRAAMLGLVIGLVVAGVYAAGVIFGVTAITATLGFVGSLVKAALGYQIAINIGTYLAGGALVTTVLTGLAKGLVDLFKGPSAPVDTSTEHSEVKPNPGMVGMSASSSHSKGADGEPGFGRVLGDSDTPGGPPKKADMPSHHPSAKPQATAAPLGTGD